MGNPGTGSQRIVLLFVGVLIVGMVSPSGLAAAGSSENTHFRTPPDDRAEFDHRYPRADKNDTTGRTISVIVLFENASVRNRTVLREHGAVDIGGGDVDLLPVLFAEIPRDSIQGINDSATVDHVIRDRGETVDHAPLTTPETSGELAAQSGHGSQTVPWGISTINARSAERSVPDEYERNVSVAVLDTGINRSNDDLDGNVVWGANFSNGVERYGVETAGDNYGHGTSVAALLAAENDSGGIVGVAPNVRLYSIKVLNQSNYGLYSWWIKGLDAAVKGPDRTLGTDDDADIVSMSLGGESYSRSLEDAVREASTHSLLVASAMNSGDGNPDTNEVRYPGKFSEVIAVAATNQTDQTTEWSSEGAEVEVAAPGDGLIVDSRGTKFSGTSAAAPHVSGTLALMMAADMSDGVADHDNQELRELLRQSAIDIDSPGIDNKSGYGLIQADSAVDQVNSSVTPGEAFSNRSAPPKAVFNRTYGGSGDDFVNDVISTRDGNYLLIGSGSDGDVAEVRKVEPDGTTIWIQSYATGQNQSLLDGVRTTDGGYALAGWTFSNESDSFDGWVVKVDSNGAKQWESTFGDDNTDWFEDVAETPNGSLIAVGTFGSNDTGQDAWILKTASNGSKLWDFVYWEFSRDADESFYGIERTPTDTYLAVGEEYVEDSDDWQALAFEIESSSDIVWSDDYGDSRDEFFLDVAVSDTGDAYFAGVRDGTYNTVESQYDSGDAWVLSLDGARAVAWSTEVAAGDYTRFNSVAIHGDHVLAAGYVRPTPDANEDGVLASLDTQGRETWNTTVGGDGRDDFEAAVNASGNGYLAAGETRSYGSGQWDGWLVKIGGANVSEDERDSGRDSSKVTTAVTVVLDGAPNGLRKYSVNVSGPAGSNIAAVNRQIEFGTFQINEGGEDHSYVVAREVSFSGGAAAFSGKKTLVRIDFEGNHSAADFELTVRSLVDKSGTAMDTSRVSLDVREPSANPFDNPVPGAGADSPPTDPDSDGLYDDVNGDGQADFDDAIALAFASTGELTGAQVDALDFDGDGDVDFDDAIELAFST